MRSGEVPGLAGDARSRGGAQISPVRRPRGRTTRFTHMHTRSSLSYRIEEG